MCGLPSKLEVLADKFKNHFLVKKAEIVSLKPEHQNEIHFLKRRISVDNMNHCKSMATPGSKGQEGNSATEKLDAKEHREFRSRAGICKKMKEQRFDIGFSTKEIMRDATGPTTASKTKLKRITRYLKGRQRCVLNFPLVGKLDDVIHVTVDADWAGVPKTRCTTSGGVLAIGPCFTFLHWSVTQATVSLSSAESEAKAITFNIELWTDSSGVKAIMQRLEPGRRAKHLEVQTMWVQRLNKIGLISLNKLGTLENVGDLLTKHVPRSVLDKLAGMMGYTFPDEEAQKFQEHTSINKNYWDQKLAAIERLPVFDDGENESLGDDVHSFVIKTSHLTTAVLRRGC